MDERPSLTKLGFTLDFILLKMKFPHTPMGGLVHGSVHARPNAPPPIDVRRIVSTHMTSDVIPVLNCLFLQVFSAK